MGGGFGLDSYWEEVDARLDDVRVYDYALNGTEIDAIYDLGR